MEFLKKNRLMIVIISIIVVVAVAAVGICLKIEQKSDAPKSSDDSKTASADKEKDGSQTADDKIYITDCDSTDGFEDKQNIQVVSDEGLYVQGKGAFMNSQTLSVFCAGKLKDSVDISKMKPANKSQE